MMIRTVCAHDCPDMCSLIAHVEDGKVVRIQGDPDHPYTAGFACGKVNRDTDNVNSPERILTPLRRIGRKGLGRFQPITWDAALDEIAAKWKAIIEQDGPLALLGYASLEEWAVRFSPLIQLGQTSLLVYWVHIEFVYGRFSILPKRSVGIATATRGLIEIFLFMVALSIARTRIDWKKIDWSWINRKTMGQSRQEEARAE